MDNTVLIAALAAKLGEDVTLTVKELQEAPPVEVWIDPKSKAWHVTRRTML